MRAVKKLLLEILLVVVVVWSADFNYVAGEEMRSGIGLLPEKVQVLVHALEDMLGMEPAAPGGIRRDSREDMWTILPPKYMLDLYHKYADDSYILESNPELTHTIRCILGSVKRDSVQFNLSGIASAKSISHAEIHLYRKLSGKGSRRKAVTGSQPRLRLRSMPKKYMSTIISLSPARGWQVLDITSTVKFSFGKSKLLTMTMEGSIPEFGTGRARYHSIPLEESLRVAYRPFLVIFSSSEPPVSPRRPVPVASSSSSSSSSGWMSSPFGEVRDLGKLVDIEDDEDEDDDEDDDDDQDDDEDYTQEKMDDLSLMKWNEASATLSTTSATSTKSYWGEKSSSSPDRKQGEKMSGYNDSEDRGMGRFGPDSFDELENSLQSILSMDPAALVSSSGKEDGIKTDAAGENNEIIESNGIITTGKGDDEKDDKEKNGDNGSILTDWKDDDDDDRDDEVVADKSWETHHKSITAPHLQSRSISHRENEINHPHSMAKRSIGRNEFLDDYSKEGFSLTWRHWDDPEATTMTTSTTRKPKRGRRNGKKRPSQRHGKENAKLSGEPMIVTTGVDEVGNQLEPRAGNKKPMQQQEKLLKKKGKEREEDNALPFPSRHHPWWKYSPKSAKKKNTSSSRTSSATGSRKDEKVVNLKKKKNHRRRNHRHHPKKKYDQLAAELEKTPPPPPPPPQSSTFLHKFGFGLHDATMFDPAMVGECKLRKELLEVSMFEWTDRVIAPALVPLNYCDGMCYNHVSLHDEQNEEENRVENIVQYEAHLPSYSTSCCSPTAKRRLVMLFADPHDNIVLRIYPNVTTTGCECY